MPSSLQIQQLAALRLQVILPVAGVCRLLHPMAVAEVVHLRLLMLAVGCRLLHLMPVERRFLHQTQAGQVLALSIQAASPGRSARA